MALRHINATMLILAIILVIAVVICAFALPRGPVPQVPPSNVRTHITHHRDPSENEPFTAPLHCTSLYSSPPPTGSLSGSSSSNTTSFAQQQNCLQQLNQGWCTDRQGNGKCVPGQLTGPDDPTQRCADWWYNGLCLIGPRCREEAVVPSPSLLRDGYHHPGPYMYRNYPWSSGTWKGFDRYYPGIDTVSVVNTNQIGDTSSDRTRTGGQSTETGSLTSSGGNMEEPFQDNLYRSYSQEVSVCDDVGNVGNVGNVGTVGNSRDTVMECQNTMSSSSTSPLSYSHRMTFFTDDDE